MDQIMITNFKDDVLRLMHEIIPTLQQEANDCKSFSYTQQRAMINRIFRTIPNYDIATIMLRLTVIDSLYSTNASYSYFSIEEMAYTIFALGNEIKAEEYFYAIACGKTDTEDLFNKCYGIRKNLDRGSKQISLLSKYAYYVLLQNPNKYPLGFPIYDSLALKTYPKVCERLGVLPCKDMNSIKDYIEALDKLRLTIFNNSVLFEGMQQFDMLDVYLWRIGKVNEGNYSLLFTHDEYETFISNIGLAKVNLKKEDGKFASQVVSACKQKANKDILKGIKDKAYIMDTMLRHWKRWYL